MSEPARARHEPARDHESFRWDRETLLVAAAAALLSLISSLIYYRAGDILLYGDAVAHINITRRVFDSRTPGLLQLGTVWLPLPHLLMTPFVATHRLWQSGIGGSIPSMLAYILGVVGIFRLMRALLGSISVSPGIVRMGALSGAAIYGLNPNLLYIQSTAMTESIYLALFVWAVVYFQEFVSATRGRPSSAGRRAERLLWKSGLYVAAASLTRYDGWFLSVSLGLVLGILWWREGRPKASVRLLVRYALILAAIPIFWLTYNALVYRNPLEFANGPYSAKAIEQKTSVPGSPPHPGASNLPLAALYFLKCAEINVAEGRLATFWFLLAGAATLVFAVRYRRLATPLLLWSPVAFYTLSIAYGGVPIFMPQWYPYSAYNVRYGLQLLPAFAVFLPIAVLLLTQWMFDVSVHRILSLTAGILLGWSYLTIWHDHPVCYREAFINSRSRVALESQLAAQFSQLPPNSMILMYLGNHVGALQQAGIPLRRSVNEGNHRVWIQPSDPEGLWERSLANPAQFVDFVVAIDGDPVAQATRGQSLSVVSRIAVEGQPSATIYRAR
jgi:hypothetical protein